MDSDDDAAGSAPPAFPSMAGSVGATTHNVTIANGATVPATLSSFDHSFTIPTPGRVTIRQNHQYAPLAGEGYGGRAQPSPVLTGIALANADGSAELSRDVDWSEGFTLDNGFGLYGLCNLNTELFYDAVLPAGTYRARLLCWSYRGDANTPRVNLARLKTKWILVP